MSLYDVGGQAQLTIVTGSSYTGLYSSNGNYNGVIDTTPSVTKGLYHPCGAYNIQITDGTKTTNQAPDGALYAQLSYQGNYTLPVSGGGTNTNPIQANYILGSDFTNFTFWNNFTNTTAASANTLMETAVNAIHLVTSAAITRTAGVKTFRISADFTPNLGRSGYIQVFDSTFTGLAQGFFDFTNNTIGFSSATNGFVLVGANVLSMGQTKARGYLDFTTDGVTTGFFVQIGSTIPPATSTFLGDITKGIRAENIWLYNKNAGAGGS